MVLLADQHEGLWFLRQGFCAGTKRAGAAASGGCSGGSRSRQALQWQPPIRPRLCRSLCAAHRPHRAAQRAAAATSAATSAVPPRVRLCPQQFFAGSLHSFCCSSAIHSAALPECVPANVPHSHASCVVRASMCRGAVTVKSPLSSSNESMRGPHAKAVRTLNKLVVRKRCRCWKCACRSGAEEGGRHKPEGDTNGGRSEARPPGPRQGAAIPLGPPVARVVSHSLSGRRVTRPVLRESSACPPSALADCAMLCSCALLHLGSAVLTPGVFCPVFLELVHAAERRIDEQMAHTTEHLAHAVALIGGSNFVASHQKGLP